MNFLNHIKIWLCEKYLNKIEDEEYDYDDGDGYNLNSGDFFQG